ncbi:MAG: FAD-linked oxidase C-terminal domain-containing protein [Bacteroidales bacterium]
MTDIVKKLEELNRKLSGEVRFDLVSRTIYSTDASAYREMPLAIVYPAEKDDIKKVLDFARTWKVPVTARGAGTSLAGQVVASGIILDISRFMNNILELNTTERWVRVEPGVVLDELNMYLKSSGLFFGPETSTANRCNIGGMVGNNACGLHSLVYGSTRDHIIEMNVILSDGTEARLFDLNREEFDEKCKSETLEGGIYRNIRDMLNEPENRTSITAEYPDNKIKRRNTGYALDILLDSKLFNSASDKRFNLSSLVAGSEGTLAIVTEVKLNLVPIPFPNKALVCVHLNSRNESFKANLVALKHSPSAVELMDDRIIALTEGNITQRKNRFFIEGNPGAIVIIEFSRETPEMLESDIKRLIDDMKSSGFGYAYPVIRGKDISRVWDLRKAGLGVLSNMKGDAKPVSLIEDTAIGVDVLPGFMEDLEKMLDSHGKDAVYHAHIGTGELHIRPVLDLKKTEDVELFRTIGEETAWLVKKYRGSLSGEHGDGRLRGEFIPIILGDNNMRLLKSVKKTWDPYGILNPGKITDTVKMNSFLRYEPGTMTREIETYYDFSPTLGVMRAAENCNGSGDCRKTEIIGGLMCPSYMATRDEKNTTRARANVLREFMSKKGDPWDHPEIYEILDLCLSCKGCKSECPSNVDIAKLKSEFLQHWYDAHHVPLRTFLIAWLPTFNRLGSILPAFYNFFLSNKATSTLIKSIAGFARERSIPLLYKTTLRKWLRKNLDTLNPAEPTGELCLFVDEFTDFNDTEIGIKAVRLLTSLNYKVIVSDHAPSARTYISKGMLRRARSLIRENIKVFSDIISENRPLVGLEPSAILGFRDEYPDLAGDDLKNDALSIASNSLLFDEFIAKEFAKGRIKREQFTNDATEILVHTHCQQKAIASSASLIAALSIPSNYMVKEIPSGCCGMAGAFGYEKEHFELSNKVGELVLFPTVREASSGVIISAPGTSCRHHVHDATGRRALHPVEVLYNALVRE